MIKVALITPDAQSIVPLRLSLLQAFKAAGCTVHVLTGADERITTALTAQLAQHDIRHDSISLTSAGTGVWENIKTLWQGWRWLRHHRPDVILLYRPKTIFYFGLLSLLFPRLRVISTVTGLGYFYRDVSVSLKKHASGLQDGCCASWKRTCVRWGMNLWYTLVFLRHEYVFFQNSDDREYFIRQRLISARKTELVGGSGVNLTSFKQKPLPQKPSFLLMGRLLQDKGIQEYIQACHALKHLPDVSFTLIAPLSSNPAALQSDIIAQQCQEAGIHYIPGTDDPYTALVNCQVFVLPSYREGAPRAGIEALAVGRPVITTDVPGCRRLLTPGHTNGYLVPAANGQALAAAMQHFLTRSDVEKKEMGNASRAWAEEIFDEKKVVKAMLNVVLKT